MVEVPDKVTFKGLVLGKVIPGEAFLPGTMAKATVWAIGAILV
jgi:hypothetical protein